MVVLKYFCTSSNITTWSIKIYDGSHFRNQIKFTKFSSSTQYCKYYLFLKDTKFSCPVALNLVLNLVGLPSALLNLVVLGLPSRTSKNKHFQIRQYRCFSGCFPKCPLWKLVFIINKNMKNSQKYLRNVPWEHVSFVHTRALGTGVPAVLECPGQILKNRFFSTLGGRVSIKSVSCKLRLERFFTECNACCFA